MSVSESDRKSEYEQEKEVVVKDVLKRLDYYYQEGNRVVELDCRTELVYQSIIKRETIGNWGVEDLGNQKVKFKYI